MNSHDFKWDDEFCQDYYEDGLAKKLSLYTNYRWLPEVSLPLACAIKTLYPDCSILDFGCAKGFLVRALRMLGVEAYGFEVSRYAVSQTPKEIKPFISTPNTLLPTVDLVFAKDTFEHLHEDQLSSTLVTLRHFSKKMFAIVPFGENSRYRIAEYEQDDTHKIRHNEAWWKYQFACSGWTIDKFSYRMRGFKDNWHGRKYGNGFFMLTREERGASW